MTPSLAVLIDGTPLSDEQARELWQRFSDWMEEHRGDLAGFAAREGFASIHPSVQNGKPVLIASRTTAQRPYAPVQSDSDSGGSAARHENRRSARSPSKKSKKQP